MNAPANRDIPFPREVVVWMESIGLAVDPIEIRAWLAGAGLVVKASYRLDEVARLLDISVRTAQDMAGRGDLAVIGADALDEHPRRWARRVALPTLIRFYPAP